MVALLFSSEEANDVIVCYLNRNTKGGVKIIIVVR